jgi:hypothetical protein
MIKSKNVSFKGNGQPPWRSGCQKYLHFYAAEFCILKELLPSRMLSGLGIMGFSYEYA